MSETWIIFIAEPDQPGWENRKLPMGGLTDILDEQWDYTSTGAKPKIGDRLRQFLQVEEFIDPKFPGSSTHVREGDWVISRLEEYLQILDFSEFIKQKTLVKPEPKMPKQRA